MNLGERGYKIEFS